jgi:hypothetical protein
MLEEENLLQDFQLRLDTFLTGKVVSIQVLIPNSSDPRAVNREFFDERIGYRENTKREFRYDLNLNYTYFNQVIFQNDFYYKL